MSAPPAGDDSLRGSVRSIRKGWYRTRSPGRRALPRNGTPQVGSRLRQQWRGAGQSPIATTLKAVRPQVFSARKRPQYSRRRSAVNRLNGSPHAGLLRGKPIRPLQILYERGVEHVFQIDQALRDASAIHHTVVVDDLEGNTAISLNRSEREIGCQWTKRVNLFDAKAAQAGHREGAGTASTPGTRPIEHPPHAETPHALGIARMRSIWRNSETDQTSALQKNLMFRSISDSDLSSMLIIFPVRTTISPWYSRSTMRAHSLCQCSYSRG